MSRAATRPDAPRPDGFRYGAAAQTAHWLTALLVALIWFFGLFDDDLLGERLRAARALFHETAGEAALALLAARLALRLIHPPPTIERAWSANAAAALMRFAIYTLLLAAPLSGVVTVFASGEPLSAAGLFDVASPWPINREMAHYSGEIHEAMANALLALAGLHAIAALAGHYFWRDPALRRMLPKALSDFAKSA